MGSAERRDALIVTGASKGIGACIAASAADRYAVAVNYSSDEAGARRVVEAIRAAGGRAAAVRADVGREEDIRHLFAETERALGPVVALVNNAGIAGGITRLESLEAAALQRVLAVNVAGTILCAREAVRRMSTRSGGRGGSIVNISSLAARTGGAGEWVHYAATKGAVNSFTLGLAREVAAEGIRVNAIAPGLIETGLHAANGDPGRTDRLRGSIPMGRPGLPEEVAAAVLWMLSPAAAYTTGSILEIGGGR